MLFFVKIAPKIVQGEKILARWALIEPSRIGLASSAGLPDADDRFLYLPPLALTLATGIIGLYIGIDLNRHKKTLTYVSESYFLVKK